MSDLIERGREFREAARRVRPHPANPHTIDAARVARFVDKDCALIAQSLDEAAQAITALTAAIEPVKDWYQSDEAEPRPLFDIITDIVADLQEDREQSLKIPALEKLVYIPGVFKCAKCSFVVVKSTMNMQSGTITANDAKGEKCPNDGAPLWMVTYKDHYEEMMGEAERICTEKAALTAENERLREALKATPLRAKNESGRDFDDRQTAWLRDIYNPALEGKS